jgi:hypothetical protein
MRVICARCRNAGVRARTVHASSGLADLLVAAGSA